MSIDIKQSLWVMGAILAMILATYIAIAGNRKSGIKIYQQGEVNQYDTAPFDKSWQDAQEQQAQQDMYYQDFVR